MSVYLMSLVFEATLPEIDGVMPSSAKIILLALADHASDDGRGAYPSLTRLELKTGLSRPSVCRALDGLKNAGLIEYQGESPVGTSEYRVVVERLVTLRNHHSNAALPPLVTPRYPNHHLTIHKPEGERIKKPLRDPVDDAIAGAQKAAEIERVLVALESGLRRNVARSTEWQSLARWIIGCEKDGRPLAQWLEWYKADKFRRDNAWRLTPQQIRDSWPQAFAGYSAAPEEDQPSGKYAAPEPPDDEAPQDAPDEPKSEAARVWHSVLSACGLSGSVAAKAAACRAISLDGGTLTVAAQSGDDAEFLRDRLRAIASRALVGIVNRDDARVEFVSHYGIDKP